MRPSLIVVVVSVLMAACADPPGPAPVTEDQVDAPDVAEVVCEADGTTTVGTPQVLVQPDGIHVHVLSRLDEPAEIVGLYGRDVESGETDYVSLVAPGRVSAACYPYSQHDDPEEPEGSPIEVLDPDGIYVAEEVECSGVVSDMIADFAESPIDAGPVPLGVARERIDGLEDGDRVLHGGYPDQADASVIVERVGEVVAVFGFVTLDGDDWVAESATICEESGIRLVGS